jgi:transposase-like protein
LLRIAARACVHVRATSADMRYTGSVSNAFVQSMAHNNVYLWADGIHLNVRLDEEKLCLLVMIGVRVDGTKELVALSDGYREATESWADLLRDCKRRWMRAPVLAVGDGCAGLLGRAA